jgi:hypothetical protein
MRANASAPREFHWHTTSSLEKVVYLCLSLTIIVLTQWRSATSPKMPFGIIQITFLLRLDSEDSYGGDDSSCSTSLRINHRWTVSVL